MPVSQLTTSTEAAEGNCREHPSPSEEQSWMFSEIMTSDRNDSGAGFNSFVVSFMGHAPDVYSDVVHSVDKQNCQFQFQL